MIGISFRGNSKYHYYGIRIKADSPLNQLVPDDTPVAMRQATQPQRRIVKAGEGAEGTTKTEPTPAASDSGQHRQYLGTPQDAVPQVDLTIDSKQLPQGISMHDVNIFDTLYKEHCEVSIRCLYQITWEL